MALYFTKDEFQLWKNTKQNYYFLGNQILNIYLNINAIMKNIRSYVSKDALNDFTQGKAVTTEKISRWLNIFLSFFKHKHCDVMGGSVDNGPLSLTSRPTTTARYSDLTCSPVALKHTEQHSTTFPHSLAQ
jgi:hypothetical protein